MKNELNEVVVSGSSWLFKVSGALNNDGDGYLVFETENSTVITRHPEPINVVNGIKVINRVWEKFRSFESQMEATEELISYVVKSAVELLGRGAGNYAYLLNIRAYLLANGPKFDPFHDLVKEIESELGRTLEDRDAVVDAVALGRKKYRKKLKDLICKDIDLDRGEDIPKDELRVLGMAAKFRMENRELIQELESYGTWKRVETLVRCKGFRKNLSTIDKMVIKKSRNLYSGLVAVQELLPIKKSPADNNKIREGVMGTYIHASGMGDMMRAEGRVTISGSNRRDKAYLMDIGNNLTSDFIKAEFGSYDEENKLLEFKTDNKVYIVEGVDFSEDYLVKGSFGVDVRDLKNLKFSRLR